MQWTQMQGTGTLVAFTSIFIGTSAMLEEGYDRNNPYCTGVVELDEKPRVVARIEGVDTLNPTSIKIGTPLTVRFLHRGSGANQKNQLAFHPG